MVEIHPPPIPALIMPSKGHSHIPHLMQTVNNHAITFTRCIEADNGLTKMTWLDVMNSQMPLINQKLSQYLSDSGEVQSITRQRFDVDDGDRLVPPLRP
jgi:hypothetical protein